MDFPPGSAVENPSAKAEDVDSIPGLGEGNGNPFQYSGPGNPMDRGAWWATVHGVANESDIAERLNRSFLQLSEKPEEAAQMGGQCL